MKKQLLFLLIILSALSTNAQSVSIYRAGLLTSPSYTSIKEAVAASLDKDSLVLSADTFRENMIVIDKNLSLTGTETPTSKSVIDATLDSTAIIFANPIWPSASLSLLLQNLNIVNGAAHNGPDKGGGAVFAYSGTELIVSRNCKFEYNKAGNTSPNGGAIFSSGHVTLSNNASMLDNQAAGSGGAIYAENGFSISGKVFIGSNKAQKNGGAIYFFGSGILKDTAMISDNTADIGGGIYADNANLDCLNLIFISGNMTKKHGGAIALLNSNLTIKDSTQIVFNSTDTNYGAAIYAKGNNDIYISGGLINNNKSTNDTVMGKGMAIYNDNASGGSSIVSINSARIFNPRSDNSRQNEIYNAHTASAFLSDSTWWGESDTTKLIWNIPGSIVSLRTWTVVDWSVNGGAPVGILPSFPVEAYFRLNTGGKLPPKFHWMLKGEFLCDSGSFAPSTSDINAANIVGSIYRVPYTSYSVKMQTSVDADTFRKSVWVLGLSIKEQGLNSSVKFNVYPNPSNGQVSISASDKTIEKITVTVFDLLGRVVLAKDLEPNSTTNQMHINAAAGQYILELKDQKGNTWREKIQIN